MGYSITVGNAVPEFSKDYDELYASWSVEVVTSNLAPTFINDDMTGNSNCRSPSYGVWSDFCRTVGLDDLFFNKGSGLMRDHPGCFIINQSHLDLVQTALIKYQATTDKKPGFTGWEYQKQSGSEYDAHLARLMWLEWWMRWALANCETPAIENS